MSKVILILLAILLPPLAVYLKTKVAKGTLINIVLCIFFWIPGILHAHSILLKQTNAGLGGRSGWVGPPLQGEGTSGDGLKQDRKCRSLDTVTHLLQSMG